MKRHLPFFVILQIFLVYYASGQTMIPMPGPSNACLCPSEVRGFWFTAPTNFTITGLRTPVGGGVYGQDPQYIQVIKINDPIPVLFPATSNNINTLTYIVAVSGTIQNVNIQVNAGDIIGVLGTTAFYSNWSPYGTPATSTPYPSNILGIPISLNSLVYHSPAGAPGITVGAAPVYSAEGSGNPIGRIEVYYKWRLAPPIIRGAGTYCSGDSIILEVDPPLGLDTLDYTYLWTLPDGSTSTDSILIFPNAPGGSGGPSGNYSCTVIVDTGGGFDTSFAANATIFVQQTPPAPQAPFLTTYCQGAIPDTIPVYGQNLKWYSVPEGGTFTTTQPVINTSIPGSFTYYLSQTFNNCEGPRTSVSVQVVPQSPPPIVTSPVTYCQHDISVPLEALGQNLLWYTTNTGGVGSINVPTPFTSVQDTVTWYVTQTINGCESIRVPVEVHINYRPNAVVLGSRDYVCAGDTLLITYHGNAENDGGVNFNWTFPSGSTILGGSGEGPYVVRFDSAGNRRITLVAENEGCLSPEARYDVTVRPVPEYTLHIQEAACQDDLVNLAIRQITPSIDQFVWDIAGGEKVYASETAGPYGVKWNTPGEKIITVIATDNGCISAPVQDVIQIRGLPDATITKLGDKVCAGDSLMLEGVYNPDYSYQWLPEQFFSESNSHRQWAKVDYAREITLNVTDIYNCKASSDIWVQPENCCVVNFPTAFTPNEDTRNDVFRPITLGNQKITKFVVKNRWGQQVFESADDRRGWDGNLGGIPQDIGVYFYYIKYQCSDGKYYEDKGDVMLMR